MCLQLIFFLIDDYFSKTNVLGSINMINAVL